jgi:hypothetical protein
MGMRQAPGEGGSHPHAGNHHNGYTSGTENCPFWVEGMPTVTLQRHLCPLGETSMGAVIPERVMVRAVGNCSNTTSLKANHCSNGELSCTTGG